MKERREAQSNDEQKDQRGSEGESESSPNGGNNTAAPGQEQAPESGERPEDVAQAETETGPSSEAQAEAELAEQPLSPDALEQWLRRVPDDPGGLLRRKFQHETSQRLRRGEYRAPDPEKIW